MKKSTVREEKVRRPNKVAATTEMVARLRQQEALQRDTTWSDENHPDLTSQDDINRYLGEMRGSLGNPPRDNSREHGRDV